jgi:hypothetical protein
MDPITQALLAVTVAEVGDLAAAQAHVAAAQRTVRVSARRERQLVEIAALIVAGQRARAVGLALEHTAEFADDADLLARLSAGAQP